MVGSQLLSSAITSAQLQAQALQHQRRQQQEEEEKEVEAVEIARNKLLLPLANDTISLQDSLDGDGLGDAEAGVKLYRGNDNQQQEQDAVQAALNKQDDVTDITTTMITIATIAEDINTNTNSNGPEMITELDENKAENNSELSRFYTDFVRFGFPPLIENILDIDTLKGHISDLSLYTTTTSLYNQDNTTPSPVTVSNNTSNLTITLPYDYPIYERHIFELIIRCIACVYNKKESINMSEKVLYNVVFQYIADKVR